jgi:deoxyadenosine/deoxycytidine kinase
MLADGTVRYIAVEGPIGVGKTALARRLANEIGGRLVLEGVEDNSFLRLFYEDSRRYAFHVQLEFLLGRYRQQRELAAAGLGDRSIVSDYLFAKDGIFAGVTLDDAELGLYRQLFELLDAQIPRPDLVVYLEARPDVLQERIKKRAREYERGITRDYLERLTEAFRQFFHDYTEAPLLVVDCSEIDFVEHRGDLADLIKEIHDTRQGVQHYIPLGS